MIKRGTADEASEVIVFRAATVGVTIAAAALGIVFPGKNIAYIGVGIYGGCGANIPVLLQAL